MKTLLILAFAALAAFAQPGQPGYPPLPGQIPNNALLVGPAATRYIELQTNEKKLFLARAQLAVIITELDLASYRVSETIQNSKLIELQRLVNVALEAYQKLVVEAVKEAGKDGTPGCSVDLKQDVQCPTPK